MSRSCAATRCSVAVTPGCLMCKPPWFSLPAPLRSAIWAAYRGRQRNPDRYRARVREAVDFIDNMPGPFDADEGPTDLSRTVAVAPDGRAVQFEMGRLL